MVSYCHRLIPISLTLQFISLQFISCYPDLFLFRFTCSRKTGACAILQSKQDGKCIRVFRSSTLSNSRWKPVPGERSTNYRYDGLYMVAELIGVLNQGDRLAHDLIPCGDDSSYTFCLTRSDTQSANCNRAFQEIIKDTLIVSNQSDLHLAHKQQEKKRKHSGWLPAGRLQQDQRKPVDYLQDDDVTQTIGIASCPHDLKRLLPNFIESTAVGFGKPTVSPIRMLSELHFPVYIEPTSDRKIHPTQ